MAVQRSNLENPVLIGDNWDAEGYAVAKSIKIDVNMFPEGRPLNIQMSKILVQLSELSAQDKPTHIRMEMSKDNKHDERILTDIQSAISYGRTTDTKGTAGWIDNSNEGIIALEEGQDLEFLFQVNQGSCKVDYVEIHYEPIKR